MKNFYLFILFAGSFMMTAQQTQTDFIAESEMKSASSLMNIAVNPNTANYDITYHKLEFTVSPSSALMSGKVTTTYTALSNMSTLTFDLTNELNVTSVKKNGVTLTFTQNNNNELVITLPTTQAVGTSATVEIIYNGNPADDEQAYVTSSHEGVPILWTLSEPFGAKDWWPCKQDLNDKINSIDVYITAPSQYVSVSNGIQQSAVVNGTQKTTHFHHGYPIPAYLIAIAVTNYSIFTQTAGTAPNQFPIINYIYPEDMPFAQSQVAVTLPIMNLYEELFETYPFSAEKYGHAQWNWGGGMEHTTVSFMAGFDRNLIAHELAHQWFGNKVTCGSWRDIWLNEGFAEYLSWLVIENLDGEASFISHKNGKSNNITSQPGGAVYLTESEATSVGRIFDGRLTYNKGAFVAHMLRFKLGDTNFFQGMKNYLADSDLAYDYATTPNLQFHLEAASGMDLDEFFNDWVYKQGYPTYTVTAQNTAPGQVKFTVNQTTSHVSVPFFEMPLPIRVKGAAGQQLDLILQNTSNGQIFFESVPFPVTEVIFDPKKDILSKNNNITLGTENFDMEMGILLYPNPAENVLNVSLPNNANVKNTVFYNVLGQAVLKAGSQTTWDISGLSSGVHFISLETDNGTHTIKFVKQ